jgi:hypothetical protein
MSFTLFFNLDARRAAREMPMAMTVTVVRLLLFQLSNSHRPSSLLIEWHEAMVESGKKQGRRRRRKNLVFHA